MAENLDKWFLHEEMRCGYRVTDGMKHVWAVKLDLIEKFKDVCERNRLLYFLGGSSLLGAVRCRGFMPWEDEAVFMMPREDFENLKRIASDEFKEQYFFQTEDSDPDIFLGGYARLRNSDTTDMEYINSGRIANHGIWISIGILDYLYEDAAQRRRQVWKVRFYQRLLYAKTYKEHSKLLDIPASKWKYYKMLASNFSREWLCGKLEKALTCCKGSKYLTCFGYHEDRYMPYLFERDYYEKSVQLGFEWLQLPAPVGYDDILKAQYGDGYLEYRPVEKHTSHDRITEPEISYKSFLTNFDVMHQELKEKTIVVFGAGKIFVHYLEHEGKNYLPEFTVDNNSQKWGREVHNFPVKPPEAVFDVPANKLLVIICSIYYREITKQLNKMGINQYYIYVQEKTWKNEDKPVQSSKIIQGLYKDVIIRLFRENFESYKHKSIVIYGTGDMARFIIEEFADYNIIGLLDSERKHGTALGKRILSYEEVASYKPDIVIVAEDKSKMKMIYDSICYLCYTYNIRIYAIDGRNLFSTFGYGGLTHEQQKYGEVSESKLREEIIEHDIISFDIFDVLIMRKTLMQEDVIDIVESRLSRKGVNIPEFKELRLRAEKEAENQCGTIYDIYKKMIQHAGIEEDILAQALATELDVEKDIICCREKMKELLLFAIQNGKQVYLIADSYFPLDIMKGMLEDQGITQYENILLSCEYKKTKEQGLFAILKEEAKGKRYLHIGKNREKNAEANDINTFIIASAYDMFCMSSYRNLQYSINSANERSMAGMLIAKVFNDPFSLYQADGRPTIDRIYDFGYVFIAPMLAKYVLWIIEEVSNGQYEDVLFAARDGFITHKLYTFALQELGIKLPKGIYFQTSRTLCINASVKGEEDIRWIADVPHAYAPDSMLIRRFSLDADEVIKYDESKFKDVVTYALYHKDKIYKKSEAVRNNYMKYMKAIGLHENKKYAFVDFVSSGTCQQMLEKFIPFTIEGLYFCKYYKNDEAKLLLKVRSLFENLYEKHVYSCYAYEKYLILETMMTSLMPSLASMDENGEPVYGMEVRSDEEMQYVIDIHRAIEDYFCDFLKHLYVHDSDINKHFTDTIFSYREQEYTNECCKEFDNLMLLEDLGQWRMLLGRNY